MEQIFLSVLPWREVQPDTVSIAAQQSSDLPRPGTIFLIETTGARIGRHRDCEVCIRELAVSNEHAKITFEHGNFWLVDCGSRNGTFLNDVPVKKANEGWKAKLCDGDILDVGLRIRFEVISSRERQQAILDAYAAYYSVPEPSETNSEGAPSAVSVNDSVLEEREEEDSIPLERPASIDELRSVLMKRTALEGIEERKRLRVYRDRAKERRHATAATAKPRITTAFSPTATNTSLPSPLPTPPPSRASLHVPLSASNIGFQLLQRMGWKAGSGLGTGHGGILEPIIPQTTSGRRGVGVTHETLATVIDENAVRARREAVRRSEDSREN